MLLPQVENWQIYIEFDQLNLDYTILDKSYLELSEGERCKIQLVAMFLDDSTFPLIDEPTNNLDLIGRKQVIHYLQRKSGFIITSHDEYFLNDIVTHVIHIEHQGVVLTHGNITTFKEEREKYLKDLQNSQIKLKKDITRLESVSQTVRQWATKREKETRDASSRRIAAKQMKRAKAVEKRISNKIIEKEKLIQPIENNRVLKMNICDESKKTYLELENYSLSLNGSEANLFMPLTTSLISNDRIWLKGKNGIGKTILLENILGIRQEKFVGIIKNSMENVSYVSQQYMTIAQIRQHVTNLDRQSKEMFYFNLNLIGFKSNIISNFQHIDYWSMGEIRKIMLSLSLVKPFKLIVWDEISNYLDMETLDKIINAVQEYKPTMLFVDHNEYFSRSIANKILTLKK